MLFKVVNEYVKASKKMRWIQEKYNYMNLNTKNICYH